VRLTGLIGQSKVEAAAQFCDVVCMLSSREVALVQGELACVHGELFVVFELWFDCLCPMFELVFFSVVSSCCPCLRVLRFVFFK
jgi:hypothetical protein